MISSSKNRVQEIKNRFENLNHEIAPVRIDSQLYKHKHGFTANIGKENSECNNDTDISPKKEFNIANESHCCEKRSPQPNSSYLYNKIDVKRSVSISDTKNTLSRQISDPGKKLHRSHAFRCDRSQKITSNSPKRHGSCNGRSETSDFSLKMDNKLSKERLKRLGNFLEEQMRKENFVPCGEYRLHIDQSSEQSLADSSSDSDIPSHNLGDAVEKLNVIPQILVDSIPDSDVPPHILQQYAQVIKPKRRGNDKQDAMTDSGVSSETENVDDDKTGRIKKLRSQFESSSVKSNLPAMDEFCNSSETIRLERKNPHLKLTDTLKKALKQPLPAGPPPKKPPRVGNIKLTSTPEESIDEQKKEAMRKLEKLESLLQQKRESSMEKPEKSQAKQPKEIHYLCTEILDITNRTLLPNQTSDPISRCLNSLNCAITNNSTSSLPYIRLKTENQNSLTACCCSTDSLERLSNQSKCFKCTLNKEKEGRFKCHLNCQCVVKNCEFYVNENIYDVPYSEDDIKVVKKNTYGTLNTLKSSKSMDDLRLKKVKNQNIYDIPCDYRAQTPDPPASESAPSTSEFAKLLQNFEHGFPETEIKKTVFMNPKPILVSKIKTDVKFNTEVKRNKNKNEGSISFTLPKRDVQLNLDRENLNCLMNELFETVTAVCNMDENRPGSFPTEQSDSSTSEESVKLTRSLTEKRKNYVRRVSTRVAYLDPKNIKRLRNQTSVCSYKSEVTDNQYATFRSWKSFRTSQGNITKMDTGSKYNLTDSRGNLLSMKDMLDSSTDTIDNLSIDEKAGCIDLPFEPREKGLFNLSLLVGLNYMTGQAYVKSAFPSQARVPQHIENLVFPETMSAAPKAEWSVDAKSQQCYSLVLTDERGERAYGYCRRVLPEGASTCLPLCYCLIGRYRAPGFYYKVLEEIESHHGRSDFEIHSLLQQLFDTDFPNPGEEISILYTNNPHSKHHEIECKRSRTLPEKRLVEKENISDLENNNRVDVPRVKVLKRPIEPRIDEDNMSTVLDVLGAGLLIKVFASLLLERKVIIIGNNMRLVSSCVEALQGAVYPFVWQQPLISAIPSEIQREVLEAPLPILAGMLQPATEPDFTDVSFEEGMLIDLTHPSKVLFYQGDESTILPTSCYKTLKTSLQLETARNRDSLDNKTRNVMISEAFLRFFVDILGDFWQYFLVKELKEGDIGSEDVVFDKEQFIKGASSKQNQYFLEWFTETAMFTHFIQNMALSYHHRFNDALTPPLLVDTPLPNFYELFNDRIKIRHKTVKNLDNSKSNYKNAVNKKIKFLKSKLRELVA